MLTELNDYGIIFLACDAHVQCASGSVVEHLLAKEGAAGSIPVSRLFFCTKRTSERMSFLCKNEPNPGLEGSRDYHIYPDIIVSLIFEVQIPYI